MKLLRGFSVSFIAIIILFAFVVAININAQQYLQKNIVLTSVVLEDFETNAKGWTAEGSKYTKTGYPQWQTVEDWPTALFGKKGDGVNKNVLGIRTGYFRMGYNFLKILPKEPIKIQGIVSKFYIWVWGANFNYDMELQVTDHNKLSYVLPVGRLNYLGWKAHTIEVPTYIPQRQTQLPRLQSLLLDHFIIWSLPGAPLENFYMYLDHFTVLTDLALETYDGDTLNNVNDLWTAPQSQQPVTK